MNTGCDYIAIESKERFNARNVLRFPAAKPKSIKPAATRIFVPFSGFNGQQLAGSGALVWEGELLG